MFDAQYVVYRILTHKHGYLTEEQMERYQKESAAWVENHPGESETIQSALKTCSTTRALDDILDYLLKTISDRNDPFEKVLPRTISIRLRTFPELPLALSKVVEAFPNL